METTKERLHGERVIDLVEALEHYITKRDMGHGVGELNLEMLALDLRKALKRDLERLKLELTKRFQLDIELAVEEEIDARLK